MSRRVLARRIGYGQDGVDAWESVEGIWLTFFLSILNFWFLDL